MNHDDLIKVWRSQDLSPLYGVDENLLHQALRQEQAKLERFQRRVNWFAYASNAVLLISAALFLAIMIDPNDDDVLTVWDYVVGVVGVGASIVLAGALLVVRRAQLARSQGFGDSVRDHLRRRIALLGADEKRERRLAAIIAAAGLIGAWAISFTADRINDVPRGEGDWSPLPILVVFAFICLWLFRWAPRSRRRKAARKLELEALLKALEGQ
jgi:peptidoglycan/LPS O-acetylase OafA/YrhL